MDFARKSSVSAVLATFPMIQSPWHVLGHPNVWPTQHGLLFAEDQLLSGDEISTLLWNTAMCQLEAGDPQLAGKTMAGLLETNPDTPLRPLIRFYLFVINEELIDAEPPSDWIPIDGELFAPDDATESEKIAPATRTGATQVVVVRASRLHQFGDLRLSGADETPAPQQRLVQNLLRVGDDSLGLGGFELALGEGVADFHLAVDPHRDGQVSLLGDLVVFRAGDAVEDGQWNVGQATFFLGDFFELGFVLVRIVRQQRHERGHFLVAVLADDTVNLLDERDDFWGHLAGEDVDHRTITELAAIAQRRAFAGAGDVLDVVGGRPVADLQAGLQFGRDQRSGEHRARHKCHRQNSTHFTLLGN